MICNRPPMGWNSWNTFGENISESLVLSVADALISTGLAEAGYRYVVIDDCWALKERDEKGRLVHNAEKFPHGMRYLADKLHEKGLKFGMYSCCGVLTCMAYPGSFEREWEDAQTFASWGVDFLKYDFCYRPNTRSAAELYRTMSLALANSGRDILFSACSWGEDGTPEWIRTTGADMWRSTRDIMDNWVSIKSLLEAQASLFPYGGRGCFNDMDMLVVGMNGKGNVGLGGCTPEEYATHFAAWCLYGSPLMIGGDPRSFDEATLALLKNPALIRIDQDEKGNQPFLIGTEWGEDSSFARLLANGDVAIGMFNLTDDEKELRVLLPSVGISVASGKKVELTDCFTGERQVLSTLAIRVQAKAHGCAVYRAKVING